MMKLFKRKVIVSPINTDEEPTKGRWNKEGEGSGWLVDETPTQEPRKRSKAQAVRAFFREVFGIFFKGCCKRQRSRVQEEHSKGLMGIHYMSTSHRVPASDSETEYIIHHATHPSCEDQSTNVKEIAPMTLEGFKFHCLLGEGGYGKVVLASHISTDEPLAVKLIRKSKKGNSKSVLQERNVLESVGTNLFCTHAFGTFQTEDQTFLVMEYLSGGDLFDYISACAPLDISTTRFFTAEIICGLQFLHGRGIVHRDLKPENILLDSIGHLKIADFGTAVTNVFGLQTLTEIIGSPGFLAPEIHKNLPFGIASDYFSLGVIVYEMATGHIPFRDSSDFSLVGKSICSDCPYFPAFFDVTLKDLIKKKLLCKCPEKRLKRITNVRSHPFFKTVDWVEVECGEACPPFTMQKCSPLDLTREINIDELMAPSDNVQKPHLSEEEQKLYCGFLFVSRRWGEIQRAPEVMSSPCRRTPDHHRPTLTKRAKQLLQNPIVYKSAVVKRPLRHSFP